MGLGDALLARPEVLLRVLQRETEGARVGGTEEAHFGSARDAETRVDALQVAHLVVAPRAVLLVPEKIGLGHRQRMVEKKESPGGAISKISNILGRSRRKFCEIPVFPTISRKTENLTEASF